jgi:hypothetical protein
MMTHSSDISSYIYIVMLTLVVSRNTDTSIKSRAIEQVDFANHSPIDLPNQVHESIRQHDCIVHHPSTHIPQTKH